MCDSLPQIINTFFCGKCWSCDFHHVISSSPRFVPLIVNSQKVIKLAFNKLLIWNGLPHVVFVYPLLNLLATYHQQKQHTVALHRYIKKQTHGGYWQLVISLKNAPRKINKYKQYQKLLLKFLFVQICWAGNLQIFHDLLISKFQRSTCKIGHTLMLFFSTVISWP